MTKLQKNLNITKAKIEDEKFALNRRNRILESRCPNAEGCYRNKGSDANELSERAMKIEAEAEEDFASSSCCNDMLKQANAYGAEDLISAPYRDGKANFRKMLSVILQSHQ